ncbi:MAG: sortase [Chloroflexi bacterium]|nr:sortase [Chloroflexota bacterium]
MNGYLHNFISSIKPILGRVFVFLLLLGVALTQMPAQDAQAQAGNPQLILTKSTEGNITNAEVGDIIRYRIRFECSSLTTACGEMEISDVLPAGMTYLPPPNSDVPAGFTINETAGTVTITKDDNNLLDGSQYDATIAVRVDYDLRPLPATLTNTVTGWIDPPGPVGVQNATPSSAPPITINGVTVDWDLNKVRVSPLIEPTVDTDVTYQLELCPVSTSGNVELTDIQIRDTLPAGAVFISATGGGVEAGGVVTWNIAGPITPPDCVARYVTIRYPSPPFNIGDSITNSGDATAEYITDTGGVCVANCYDSGTIDDTHDIIDIQEEPDYSKDDAGDPVGITGTARFILNLDTNDTNWPSDDVIMIDTLPAELQVTQVTSGTWDAAFNYVRASVEYSTDYGINYTAFPGQPISYNTGATYAAPVANITNVRWSFEHDIDGNGTYDAGLPYTWEFTTSPEIRVTPRATATTSSNGVPMPAATAGSTYTNCLQVSRTDSGGNSVTGACNNEPMTVRGDFVSLRPTKDETPGAQWDQWEDPNINTFTADESILPGDTLRYTITVDMTERSSEDLVDPTILDTLPNDLIFVRNGTARLDGVVLAPQPTFTRSGPNPGAGQTLQWDFPGLTVPVQPLGSHLLTVEFFARIPPGQSPLGNPRTNTLYVVTDSTDAFCEVGSQMEDSTRGDVDNDIDPTDPACENTDDYVVERSAALRGEKWIRAVTPQNNQVVLATTFLPDASCPVGGTVGIINIPTNPFTRYPCIAQAYPENAFINNQYTPPPPAIDPTLDDFEYNLRIFNDGNVNMIDYVLYDILPYYGDTGSGGTLASSARNSEFRPALRGPIQFLSGTGLGAGDFTIEYNATTNPCRPEVFNQPTGATIPAGCDNDWTVPWNNARSYRIRLNAGSAILPAAANELRFGVPMFIPADAPPVGTFSQDDPLSHEIAWNSFAHVGSYDTGTEIRDLLASEPRKVGITIPEVMSIGNRVWRDSDNSGTINAPDDTNPGIAGVTVNLYRDANNDGVPDGAALASATTDTEGFYLFSNIPYNSSDATQNRYIVGIPASNFNVGQPLNALRSSTGTPSVATYTNPPETNPDMADHGRDPATPGQEVLSATVTLQPTTEQTGETDLSNNNRDGIPGARRGVNAERDNNSDLLIDFGFFGGTDVPFSIGNHLWYDDGTGAGGVLNDGIRQVGELPVAGATLYIYRDGNANGTPDAGERILNRSDVTDANGFYLFDNLDPGTYFVQVVPANFDTVGDPLDGWYSSVPTGTETLGVNGGTATADLDNDDNGVNTDIPEQRGVFSGPVVLIRSSLPADQEPSGEAPLSGQANPGLPLNDDFDPTGWDGPNSRGRFGETDATSNLTIDFGFIPPMSLGNRVWIDNGAGEATFRAGYNNGVMDGTESVVGGVNGVRVELYRDTSGDGILQAGEFIRATTTANNGYYLFEYLQPGNNYYIHIPDDNFGDTGVGDLVPGNPLLNYISSFDRVAPADDATDINDNGIDNGNVPLTTGVTSQVIVMAYGSEPTTPPETDISPNVAAYGTGNVGRQGQTDASSNLTVDFGFVQPPRSTGNYLWFDVDNDRVFDVGELPVPNALVRLYRDANNNGVPDDLGVVGNFTDDWLAWDTTDAGGFYLFDNLPPNRYLVGVDYTNFQAGQVLEEYASSTGTTTNPDSRDNGIDRILPGDAIASPHGILSANINLTLGAGIPNNETLFSADTGSALGFNPTVDDGPASIGRYGETNLTSHLRIDFGFYKPMSLGNRVWRDDGTGVGGVLNDGIMNGGELPFANVRVELYRDTNNNGVLNIGAGDTLVNFDNTDLNGYYLFDGLIPGNYFVHLPLVNFTGAGALTGWSNSTPTFADNADVNDNGINNTHPEVNGITSNMITLTVDAAPTGETQLSGQANPANGTEDDFSPTGWDGPASRGRWNESDDNSNLTVDFGFIPPLSLGNRVWIDDGTTATGLLAAQFNNGLQDGTELGRANVALNLYFDANNDGVIDGTVVDGVAETTPYRTTTTDANGYYIFDGLPQGRFYVQVAPANFAATNPLENYVTSTGSFDNETGDLNDNGVDSPTYLADGIRSIDFILGYGGEPSGETVSGNPLHGPNGWGRYGEADASSNLTLDFGFMSPRSLGNRVWLDDGAGGGTANDGLINGTEAGIDGVLVSLYLDSDGNGVPDGPAILTDTTSNGGYYLFSNFPAGRYVVGVNNTNFTTVLANLASSTDVVAPVDANPDNSDHGIDQTVPAATLYGILSPSIDLRNPPSEPVGETDLSGIPADGPNSRGTHNETDAQSDLTVDFGFFYPFSLGNRVFRDNGFGGGTINDGIMNGGELPIANVRVELYRDTNGTAGLQVGTDTLVRFDTTDAGGFYLFDGLSAGEYYVHIPAVNFAAGNPLRGLYNSTPTGTEAAGVAGNPYTPNMDRDDNGVNDSRPDLNGISSGPVVLAVTTEPVGEIELSADTGTAVGNSPTVDDGPNSRGRYGENDNNSNLTIDFGFIPPLSLGNRVWIDNGSTATGLVLSQFDDGLMNGNEAGRNGVVLNLYFDANNDGAYTGGETAPYLTTTTDATGYYLFDNLPPGRFYVQVAPANFAAGNALDGFVTSSGSFDTENADVNDNGVDSATYLADGIRSIDFILSHGAEPLTAPGVPTVETDINNSGTYGPNNVGNFGQTDADSNLTLDFGFISPPHSIGNRLWFDSGVGAGGVINDGILNGTEPPVVGARVSLYSDTNGDGQPDDINVAGNQADNWLAWDTTDAGGYYLFDNLPPGRYLVGVDNTNFQAGQVLEGYASSTGNVDNAANDTDSLDNGVDRIQPGDAAVSPYGILSTSINLAAASPLGEADLSADTGTADGNNPTVDDGPNSRGRNGETDVNSDLTIDFGFHRPMSLGNRVWRDDGTGVGGIRNNGIMDGGETPIPNVRVELYLDDGDNAFDAGDTLVNFDVTDVNGYYLFDHLMAGNYFVHIPAANFATTGALFGLNNSEPTATENAGMALNPYTPDTDRDDNGVNDARPDLNGITSGEVTLTLDTEPTGEAELSGEANPGAPANAGVDPTGWDGSNSRGRFSETDNNSNLTIDFGFLPVYSLGNRVWFDTGGTTGIPTNGILDGDEAGVGAITVNLYLDANNDGVPDGGIIATDVTDANGFYRFDNLIAGTYIVEITPPAGYGSTVDTNQDPDNNVDNDDNGVITLPTGAIRSHPVTLGDAPEPTLETTPVPNPDLADGEAPDAQSNRTVDFGLVNAVAIGNVVWFDTGAAAGHYNNGIFDADETGVDGVTVNLYYDADNNGTFAGGELTPFRTTVTAGGGFYQFDQLVPGRYYVAIPNTEFLGAEQLVGYTSSTDDIPATTDQTLDDDTDENGQDATSAILATNGIRTIDYVLAVGAMPLTDDETSYTGSLLDDSVNFTADFGFTQAVAIGNRVWLDTGAGVGQFNNSRQDALEPGVPNVTVQLFSPGADGAIGGGDDVQIGADVFTDANGDYVFDGLMPGDYYVHIPATEFQAGGDLFGYASTTGQGANETSDQNADENGSDNAPSVNGVSTQVYNLTLNGEPDGVVDDETGYPGVLDDNDVNYTADFGFTQLVAIGNVVWFDTGAGANYNNGVFDLGETGVDGVTVNLYTGAGVFVGTTVTAGGGFYEFDNLNPGTYFVGIPNTEFNGTEQLVGYTSSTDDAPATTDQTLDDDTDENGLDTNTLLTAGIHTIAYILAPGTMPITDDEASYGGNLDSYNVNFTADFGFVNAYSLGNIVWFDADGNGLRNGAETGLVNVTVNLYRDSNNDGNPDGGIIAATTTGTGGYYRFDNLVADTYIVEVEPPAGYASTIDAGDADVDVDDDDDNGVVFFGSNVRSQPVTLEPGSTEPIGDNNPLPNPDAANGEAPDTRSNRTVDFGFIVSTATSEKELTATDQTFTPETPAASRPVAIGEILTYEARFSVPSGATMINLVARDQLDPGLAFVGCDSITVSDPGLTTNLAGGFAAACNPDTNPTVAPQTGGFNDASQMVFSLGNVTNATADTQTLTITYRVIVLDVPGNVDGVSGLNNSVTWTWGGGNVLPTQANPVRIVEPDLSIDKRATPQRAPYGSTIHFTIDIAHTAASSTDAFDVIVTDQIPTGLTIDTATISVTGTASTPGNFAYNFDVATNILTVTWNVFRLGETGRIEFDAVFVGPAPVTNSASVQWSSLPIDPQPSGLPEQLSPYNDFSTERWYDPTDTTGLNPYGEDDSVVIALPVVEEGDSRPDPLILPTTGFAPDVVTELPPMPSDFAYAQTEITIEIPKLKQTLKIAGVPYDKEKREWNLTWLNTEAGWLENTAFPTHSGNSAITAHTTLSNGKPGPFAKLDTLSYGDQIIVHLDGQKYIFEVRDNKRVKPDAVNATLKHEEYPWLTLITCKSYDEKTGKYTYRTVVRAVLVKVVDE